MVAARYLSALPNRHALQFSILNVEFWIFPTSKMTVN